LVSISRQQLRLIVSSSAVAGLKLNGIITVNNLYLRMVQLPDERVDTRDEGVNCIVGIGPVTCLDPTAKEEIVNLSLKMHE
jgi:hypothetical protein